MDERPLSRSNKALVRGLVAAVLVVVALSTVVGFVGTDDGFDWNLAAVVGTAIGTTLLAGTTGALAFLTRGEVNATQQLAVLTEQEVHALIEQVRTSQAQAEASEELARLTKRDQDERQQPVVLQQQAGWKEGRVDPKSVFDGEVLLTLRNVGLGPALRVQVTARYVDADQPIYVAHQTIPSILPGETIPVRLYVMFSAPRPEKVRADGFPVVGTYFDRAQRERYEVIASWDRAEARELGDDPE
jgi:hypothetical protein